MFRLNTPKPKVKSRSGIDSGILKRGGKSLISEILVVKLKP
jgi:hypothetical protein